MPELPEVETVLRALEPALIRQRVTDVVVRQPKLRWPIPEDLMARVSGQRLLQLTRRAKYLLFHFETGVLLCHLGMSGRLRLLVDSNVLPTKHDHLDVRFDSGQVMRYHDPRRFGAWLWLTGNPMEHPLLKNLGPEPLTEDFSADYLGVRLQNCRQMIKQVLLDGKIVVGIGNIYANEALFCANIRPNRLANALKTHEFRRLVIAIRQVLVTAIQNGGTTLKDFQSIHGELGYFKQKLQVYGREQQPCYVCNEPLQLLRIQGRSTVFCSRCQP